MKETVVIVEDERAIADTVVYALEREGFQAIWCDTASEGLEQIQELQPALAILDIGLPDKTGLELCKDIRAISSVPIIFLSARSEELDRILGLELGGDDYITKPFSPRELVARVRSVLRRHHISKSAEMNTADEHQNETKQIGSFEHKIDEMRVSFHGKDLELSTHEYKLLTLLLSRPKRVYSREEILYHAWDEPEMVTDRTVDAHIKAIRKKMKSINSESDPIRTVRGIGYSIDLEK